ncbi:4-(cytidine 5'-diphospho)-2-C-methyl-D-erythritol kinase [Polymorphobacter sp.]|uniref:4-(cytidine 5'-diphospho)-2-C-methyl-D-erythritol kinase n=1 Tax=Polymorphobacter sp. TaxID=1909290 RepID=UPI003F700C1C
MTETEDAPAKLNLALHLRHRRADGYHELESIFAFTQFGDTLTGAPADALSLEMSGDYAGPAGQGGDNLVLRAARALAEAAGIDRGARLHLEKRIPVAAGLGGGSADAAAALRLLNRLWGLDWPQDRLVALAAKIGSDVPACVVSRSVLGSGRGEVLRPWSGDVGGRPVLLVNPRVSLATGPVFAAWDRQDRGPLDAEAPLTQLRNDMTAAACGLAPVIAEVLEALAATVPLLARMSGSGATCFALYESGAACTAAETLIAARGWWHSATVLR